MKRLKKTIMAGNIVWETISPCYSRWDSEAQKNAIKYIHKGGKSSQHDIYKNQRISREKTAQLIAANVKPMKWILCTFTFSDIYLPKTRKEAEQKFRYFLVKARRFEKINRKNMRTEKLLYFWTLETGENNRYHIHFLVNIPQWYKDQFMKLWKYATVTNAKPIAYEFGTGSNAYALSTYMLKEQFKQGEPAGTIACKHSRGLLKPIIHSEYVAMNEHLTLPDGAMYTESGCYYSSSKYADGNIYQYERHSYILDSPLKNN